MEIESLIRDLAFILLLGAVVTIVFKLIKQPVVLGYIVAGFLASPNFEPLPSVTTETNIEFWAQIGIIVLLFSLGLEFSFKKLVNVGGSAVVTALIIVSGMMATGYGVGRLLDFTNINSLFLGGMLSMSSTTIIIKALTDLNLRQKKFASLVFAVLVVEDLFAVVMMVILSSLALGDGIEGEQLLFNIGKLVFFLILWFLVGVYVIPTAFNKVRALLNRETLLVVSMGLCLGMAVFSVYCGFSLALGAFVMGSILAGTSYAERIEHVVEPVKDLFGAVFFISVGMMVQPAVIVGYWQVILLLSVIVIMGMIVFGTGGMLLTGQSLKVAVESGFSLTQIGEFAFIIASLGMSLGVLDATIYPIVVAVSVITTFTTPYFIKLSGPFYNFLERVLPKRLSFLLDRYSGETSTAGATRSAWSRVLRRYAWRVVLYSIVLIAITVLSDSYFMPWMTTRFEKWGQLVGVVATLAVMSPFLMALCMPTAQREERRQLRAYRVPRLVMRLFRIAIAVAFIVHLLGSQYSARVGVLTAIAVTLLILMLFSQRVRKNMRTIEKTFVNNLNERELRKSGRNNNLVGDLHLAYMKLQGGSMFVGRRLADTGLLHRHGVNVVSIQRDGTFIPAPGGNTRLFPGDVVGVTGTDANLQELLPLVEVPRQEESLVDASQYGLLEFTVGDDSVMKGKTLAQIDLRGKYKTTLVAVMRDDQWLESLGSIVFAPGDMIWAVGPRPVVDELS